MIGRLFWTIVKNYERSGEGTLQVYILCYSFSPQKPLFSSSKSRFLFPPRVGFYVLMRWNRIRTLVPKRGWWWFISNSLFSPSLSTKPKTGDDLVCLFLFVLELPVAMTNIPFYKDDVTNNIYSCFSNQHIAHTAIKLQREQNLTKDLWGTTQKSYWCR